MLQETAKKCPAFSSVWIQLINALYILVGCLLIGLSSWGITQQKEDPVTAALPAGGLGTIVFVGVVLVLVAIVGILGVRFNYHACGRATLGIYATILILLMIFEFAAAGVIISFSNRLDEFGPALQVRDQGAFYLINQSYIDCCCSFRRCPNDTCWLPANLLYPCDSRDTFRQFLTNYIDEKLMPIGVIAILIAFVQLFTAIAACCNQCKGRQAEEQRKIGGPVSYDGGFEDGGYAYDSYVKTGEARPGSAAAAAGKDGATAPKASGAKAAPAKK